MRLWYLIRRRKCLYLCAKSLAPVWDAGTKVPRCSVQDYYRHVGARGSLMLQNLQQEKLGGSVNTHSTIFLCGNVNEHRSVLKRRPSKAAGRPKGRLEPHDGAIWVERLRRSRWEIRFSDSLSCPLSSFLLPRAAGGNPTGS